MTKMIDAIFTSKLYQCRSKKGQEKLVAAIDNPINKELVTQLREYLDDSDQDTLEIPKKAKPNSDKAESNLTNQSDTSDIVIDKAPSNKSRLSDKLVRHTSNAKPTEEPEPKVEEPEDSEPEVDDNNSATESEESEGLTQSAVANSICVAVPSISTYLSDQGTVNSSCYIPSLASFKLESLDPLKGMLNARDDTAGVSYIKFQNEELWIYYNDKINLNTVMEPVITLLASAGYHYLNFSRLARTDNAIVFTIETVRSV